MQKDKQLASLETETQTQREAVVIAQEELCAVKERHREEIQSLEAVNRDAANRLQQDRDQLEKDREALAKLDGVLHGKELALQEREQAQLETTGSLRPELSSTDEQNELKAQLDKREETLKRFQAQLEAREHKVIKEAHESRQAADQIRVLTRQLREREIALNIKEERLAASLAEYKEAQGKVRMMAEQLHKRDEALNKERTLLEQNVQDCERLQAELTSQQNQFPLEQRGFHSIADNPIENGGSNDDDDGGSDDFGL